MKNEFYKSEDGNWRVVYEAEDLGCKYKLQKMVDGAWRHSASFDSPSKALTAMKRASGEWRKGEWT